ncbi:MAG: GNAT family N-acetyltransferase [Chloroflexota bacterium]|nr:GNAT family N-acetyltransferase [Chloroflexota bacterium]
MTALNRGQITLELPVTFRLATKADLPKLEWYGQYAHFRRMFRRTFVEQTRGHRWMLLADCNDYPIGQVFVQLRSGEQHLADGARRAYLYALRVMDMFRGNGIGTHLLNEAETMLWAGQFRWVTIAAAKDNPGARRLYERLGYRVFAEDPGDWSYVDQRGVAQQVHEPCWIMEKRLSSR